MLMGGIPEKENFSNTINERKHFADTINKRSQLF